MEKQTLKAEVRTGSGKGPARQLRMRGLIPAVFYGPNKQPMNLQVAPGDIVKALKGEYLRNQLIELDFGTTKELAIVRDVASDPLTRQPLHVDFYSVALDRPVHANVPFFAHGRAKGVAEGGVLHKIFREIPVFGPPGEIPAKIEVDVTPLGMHQSIKAKDIPLPAGVTIALSPERNLVAVETKEREIVEEGDAAAAAAAPAAAAKGAAPAKAAAAPAKGAAPAKAAAAPAAKKK